MFRLEKLSWDTIERKTSVAETQSNKRRNRYKGEFLLSLNLTYVDSSTKSIDIPNQFRYYYTFFLHFLI